MSAQPLSLKDKLSDCGFVGLISSRKARPGPATPAFFAHLGPLSFHRFWGVVAAKTGQLLNDSHLANELDIDTKTAKAWLPCSASRRVMCR
jgi:hypothetical protein